MKKLIFDRNEVVKINNKKQFNEIYPFLRSANSMTLSEWLELVNGYPTFPIYLEWANSVFSGNSIGFTTETVNTWTKEPYKVISFKEVVSRDSDQ